MTDDSVVLSYHHPKNWAVVSPSSLLDDFNPHVQVATALVPFLVALAVRLIVGKTRVARAILTLSTMWFAINVLLAPFADDLRQEIFELASHLH